MSAAVTPMAATAAAVTEPYLGVSRSLLGRVWIGPSPATERMGAAIAREIGMPELVGRVLAARGVTPEAAADYLEPKLRDLLPDPATLRDMEKAAARLARAVLKGERIAIFGDYDVDGAASSALLLDWLRAQGRDATLYIPDRIDEGYGPNTPAMTALGKAHDLVICVDCGTLSFEPVAAAQAAGAEVIVADHHLAGETLPACAALVNPNRNDDASGAGHLCAAGVVFLLLVEANRRLRAEGRQGPDLMAALDLVALATVADVAPLTGVNRAFVRQGLKVMAARRRPGLRALADIAGLDRPPTAHHLGYLLGPRINAGGRIGKADLGARLLSAGGDEEAAGLAAELDRLNGERRRIEAEALEEAVARVEARGPVGTLVWAAAGGWHPGVLGIVAGRLRERFDRPAVALAIADGAATGSARSVEGADIGAAVLALARDGVILRGGGHRMAAGLTVAEDRLEEAMAALAARIEAEIGPAPPPSALHVDGVLSAQAATPELVEALEAAGPFGQAAPAPRVALPGMRVASARRMGTDHLALTIADPAGGRLDAVLFRAFATPLGAALEDRGGGPTHLAGRLEIDEWGGRRRARLRIEDAAPGA